jgi:hypothetical protein
MQKLSFLLKESGEINCSNGARKPSQKDNVRNWDGEN